MQILTFTVAGQPYAIPSRMVLEVLPLVPARPIPLLPDYVRGVFTYRGQLVPLVDLGRRFAAPVDDRHLRRRLSTRVVVVEFMATSPPGREQPDRGQAPVRLGLVADDVVSIQTADRAEAGNAAVTIGRAPFLGEVLRLGNTTLQMVIVEHLLPEDLLTGLGSPTTGAAGS